MYLILFIQDNTEDLCTVSLLNAGPPSNREDVMVLSGVAVIRERLLCKRQMKGFKIGEKTDVTLR